jgi:hypothetical protein
LIGRRALIAGGNENSYEIGEQMIGARRHAPIMEIGVYARTFTSNR